jgi:large subunit ribosomal protein L25
MSAGFELNAQVRNTVGKAEARRMRHRGFIPGVIYGGGAAPQMITLPHDAVLHALAEEAFHSHILDIKLDGGKVEKVVLKDVQRHAFKMKVTHVDFLRVNASEKLTMRVPLHFVGEEDSQAIKDGAVVSKNMTDVEIKCLPANLPEFIEVNIAALELDHALHLSDLALPKGVELAHAIDADHDNSVVNLHMLKEDKALEAEDAAAEATAEDQADADDAAEGEEKPEAAE